MSDNTNMHYTLRCAIRNILKCHLTFIVRHIRMANIQTRTTVAYKLYPLKIFTSKSYYTILYTILGLLSRMKKSLTKFQSTFKERIQCDPMRSFDGLHLNKITTNIKRSNRTAFLSLLHEIAVQSFHAFPGLLCFHLHPLMNIIVTFLVLRCCRVLCHSGSNCSIVIFLFIVALKLVVDG